MLDRGLYRSNYRNDDRKWSREDGSRLDQSEALRHVFPIQVALPSLLTLMLEHNIMLRKQKEPNLIRS